jgi:hydrogenase maturation protein HypF
MLRPVRLPGGAQAIRQPWRMACVWLAACGIHERPSRLRGEVTDQRWRHVARLGGSERSPLTTSMGRLFDAVAALCGLRSVVTYEGQAAIELEAACDPHEHGRYPLELVDQDGALVLDPRETIRAAAADVASGVSAGVVASRFHAAVAHAAVAACTAAADRSGTDRVVLSGGVFQNRRLLEAVAAGLDEAGLRVLVPERLPVNDGGVAYGQAAIAAAMQPG